MNHEAFRSCTNTQLNYLIILGSAQLIILSDLRLIFGLFGNCFQKIDWLELRNQFVSMGKFVSTCRHFIMRNVVFLSLLQWHPDVSKDAEAGEVFKNIHLAYQVSKSFSPLWIVYL